MSNNVFFFQSCEKKQEVKFAELKSETDVATLAVVSKTGKRF